MEEIVLFGVRSPLLPEYEETCSRLKLQIVAGVRVDDLRPRLLDRSVVVDLPDLDERHRQSTFLACAFNPYRREELADLATTAGLLPAKAVVDPTAVIPSSTRVGDGTYICALVNMGAAGVIGRHVTVRGLTNIGHHAVLGDFVSISPGVTITGNVHVGDRSFIGAGSTVLPGVRIGHGAVVAAGSVVKQNVSDNVLVAGNPARVARRRPSASMLGSEGEE